MPLGIDEADGLEFTLNGPQDRFGVEVLGLEDTNAPPLAHVSEQTEFLAEEITLQEEQWAFSDVQDSLCDP